MVAENTNETGATHVEGTEITEGKKLYLQYSKYRYEFMKNRPMRLPEYVYDITKSDTTKYDYDMDDPSDLKLYQLSRPNRKPISELLGDSINCVFKGAEGYRGWF